MSDLHIKTFHIHNTADEQTLNEFLSGKIVRHWSAAFAPGPQGQAAWNIFVAYEIRMKEPNAGRENQSRQGQQSFSAPRRNAAPNSGPRQNAPAPARNHERPIPEEYKPNVSDRD